MKLPRDLKGQELAKALRVFGYAITRQSGSHLRITTETGGQHHEVIPNHDPIKLGTLQSILGSIAAHHRMSRDDLLSKLKL
jgi:predicted RNA binding protein YcfA (HicA-like mRNA interferase family)